MSQHKPLIAITGASAGIGKACAQLFNKLGFPLLLMARRVELLEELKLTNTICAKVDVCNYEEIKEAIELAEKKYGPVDLLINNAGIMPLDKLVNLDLLTQHQMVDINVKGVLNGIHAVLKEMLTRKHGTIINVSSVAGRYTSETRSVYNATKFGVHALSESLRKETAGHNVRVIIFAPGIVNTELLKSVKNSTILEEYQKVKDTINQGLTSSEAAELIAYAYNLPQHICLKEILVSHTDQKI
ncbi:SDR family oxidoreductase [Spiroplasma sp. DGKH1]|uniref:SDR family oxidoreductase n=1 Tax=Spiroplasma sp. DGKH1 TaxID=3050074 RepID=UPI0034C68D0B